MMRFERLLVTVGFAGLMVSAARLHADVFVDSWGHSLPHWAPIWSWERSGAPTKWQRDTDQMAPLHALISQMTGTGRVGSHCVEGVSRTGQVIHLCFDENTPEWYIESVSRRIFGDFSPAYEAWIRWSVTSYGSTGPRGNPIRLRWSFILDGTLVRDIASGQWEPSNLFATLDTQFSGNTALWQNQFRRAFASWSAVAGIQFVEVSDDGAPFPDSPGSADAPRGDIRIGGCEMDGPGLILAYSTLPDVGDIVIDTSDSWYDPTTDYQRLRYVVIHEMGHSLGLHHVGPCDCTKIMEPRRCSSFDSPQDDDIRGAQRFYGDTHEVNDSAGTATFIGSLDELPGGRIRKEASLDRIDDIDYYRFTVGPNRRINISVGPIGSTYNVGPLTNCADSYPSVNTRAIQNLELELLAPDGTTVLASATANGVGLGELIRAPLYPAGGTFYVRVFSGPGSRDDVQRYSLGMSTSSLPPGDVNGDGCVDDADLLAILFHFGDTDPRYDLNGDGVVDDADLLIVLFNFGRGCGEP
jgi:hypothetical protein